MRLSAIKPVAAEVTSTTPMTIQPGRIVRPSDNW
jgi:hypothetical protein